MGGCFSSPQTGPQAVAQAAQPAAAQAAPPPSDPLSQGLGDAQQAIGLIDGIYKVVEPAVLEANNKRNERSFAEEVPRAMVEGGVRVRRLHDSCSRYRGVRKASTEDEWGA